MTDILDRLQPGWNEIARQRDVPVYRPEVAQQRNMKQRFKRKWFENGEISIEQAKELHEAGLLVMCQKRDDSRRKYDENGTARPYVGPIRPDMVLLVRRAA